MRDNTRIDPVAGFAAQPVCRWCGRTEGQIVLDLGEQPASDHFPLASDPGPDPRYPLHMWLCAGCGLAQLGLDPTVPDEVRATEPAALVEQAADAVGRLHRAGWLQRGLNVIEYGSPHGGSWLPMLQELGLTTSDCKPADVVLDCFGLMHEVDQRAALAARAAHVAPGGTLLLQFHSVASIIRLAQWNSLRHGHYAYYSATALVGMLAEIGFGVRSAFVFDLYGGTVLVATQRIADHPEFVPDGCATSLLRDEAAANLTDPAVFNTLDEAVAGDATAIRRWLTSQRRAGRIVAAYGAASRAVTLLCKAGLGRDLLPCVADVSSQKQGRRMPGTDIPVISPDAMTRLGPDAVLLMLPDLETEVSARYPSIAEAGGEWITVDDLRAHSL